MLYKCNTLLYFTLLFSESHCFRVNKEIVADVDNKYFETKTRTLIQSATIFHSYESSGFQRIAHGHSIGSYVRFVYDFVCRCKKSTAGFVHIKYLCLKWLSKQGRKNCYTFFYHLNFGLRLTVLKLHKWPNLSLVFV